MKNLMKYKEYNAKIEYSTEDACFYGIIQGINDAISFEGQSIEELNINFKEAVDDYISLCKRMNIDPEKTYKGSFNIRIKPELHKKAALLAASDGITLNKWIENTIEKNILNIL